MFQPWRGRSSKICISTPTISTMVSCCRPCPSCVSRGFSYLYGFLPPDQLPSVLEFPSQLVGSKLGSHRWLPFLMLCWGLVSLFQAFITNRAGFYICRVMVGGKIRARITTCNRDSPRVAIVFEAGFIPGAIVYASQWYTSVELTTASRLFVRDVPSFADENQLPALDMVLDNPQLVENLVFLAGRRNFANARNRGSSWMVLAICEIFTRMKRSSSVVLICILYH